MLLQVTGSNPDKHARHDFPRFRYSIFYPIKNVRLLVAYIQLYKWFIQKVMIHSLYVFILVNVFEISIKELAQTH